jgi:saccharopine dehydrogenase-like NADP-dependent oxidoreductase
MATLQPGGVNVVVPSARSSPTHTTYRTVHSTTKYKKDNERRCIGHNLIKRRLERSMSTVVKAGQEVDTFADPQIPCISEAKNIIIIGGTGRVGASTAAALAKALPNCSITLASRTKFSFDDAISLRPELGAVSHIPVDVNDSRSLMKALMKGGIDIVIHTAGPFQRRAECSVLEAAIAAGIPYLDVCDDTEYSKAAKSLHSKAIAAGVPAITCAGIYPGVSNVMAAHMISLARKEYTQDFEYVETPPTDAPQPRRILYSYFTAGSGGAGPTILKTTFLLAGEEVVAYRDGKAIRLPPVSNRRVVDFGPGVGRRSVWLYSLPEVASGHSVLGVPSISARFGTEPDFWNWAMWLLARVVPGNILANPKAIDVLAKITDPLVRAVDLVVGEKVAMLVEVELSGKRSFPGTI